MKNIDDLLANNMKEALHSLEEGGEIVITSNNPVSISLHLASAVKETYCGGLFTPNELFVLSMLAHEASVNKNLFQGELESVTGFSKSEMKVFAKKIRSLTNM